MNLPPLALNCLGFTLIALIPFNFWVVSVSFPLHCRRLLLPAAPVPCLQILEAKPQKGKPREVTS
ncbi:hypothetical protein SLEP1_g49660 [Rubroshorea leprosula]|uniref:Uncharacterized protein n=1 Tax=Rubroshorea leprosula TaxID=152421 RepID=A0AAV5LZT0_9ROSI|nr:hypothetical protein SLEP1_g49660 [Rubroshorea leprosula]